MLKDKLQHQLAKYPVVLIKALAQAADSLSALVYFAGGPVRDWLMEKEAADLDITVSGDAYDFGRMLSKFCGAVFVPLSDEEGVARVVLGKWQVDVAAFRGEANSIEEDLLHRDFTINAMAVLFDPESLAVADNAKIIDPVGGQKDLQQGILKMVSSASFCEDPLRMLRAYRFAAQYGFAIDIETEEHLLKEVNSIVVCAGERISFELHKIMESPRAGLVVAQMAANGLLWQLFPELQKGVGFAQPASHHLDVFEHSLEAMCRVEEIIAEPSHFFGTWGDEIREYLQHGRNSVLLKYAALFHDLGKPASFVEREGRRTFYNHDQIGGELFQAVAKRLKWSRADMLTVSLLIKQHMRPFHLNNSRKKTGIKPRACLKLVKALDMQLIGLFLLAMADSLAGMGPGKPEGMEEDIAELFTEVFVLYQTRVKPVLASPPLLTGHDLIKIYGLAPGPFLGKMLSELEKVRVERTAMTKNDAVEWGHKFLEAEK